jgi:chemotaxis protein MotB
MAEDSPQVPHSPIVIKRIKKGAHAHHGGAWKVAYADFVTAMMAFFLLLWLLNTTTPEQKLGLAEYFTPTIGIKDSMGIGFKGGAKQSEAGRSKSDLTQVGLVAGQVKHGPAPDSPNSQQGKSDPDAEESAAAKKVEEIVEDEEELKATSEDIKQALDQDPDLQEYKNNIVIQDTPEGLKIDMIDDEKKPMFIPGTPTLTDVGKKVLDSMARMVSATPNNIAVSGHTDAAAATANPQYTIWELSSERALAARRFMSTTQLEQERVMRVLGMADRELLVPQEPTSPRNRRVTITIMRGSYFRDPKTTPTTRGLVSVPQAKIKKEEPKVDPKDVPLPPINTGGESIFNPANIVPGAPETPSPQN